MNKIFQVFLVLFLLMKSNVLHCQIVKPFPDGLRLEAGLGYNLAKGHQNAVPEFGWEEGSTTFDAFYPTPTFRLSYQIEPLEWLIFSPFFGYDVFGGLRKSVYLDEQVGFLFYSIEVGLCAYYKITNIQLGIGFKSNKHLKIIWKTENWERDNIEEFDITDDIWMDDESFDLGMSISYKINHFTIKSDFWFSTSNLFHDQIDEYAVYRKYRFILFLGYQF